MISLEPHADGVVLPVRACPGGRKNAVTGEHGGMLKVSVTQVPEKGKANQAIIEVLSEALDFKKSQFELLSGASSSQKRFLVREVCIETVRQRLRTVAP